VGIVYARSTTILAKRESIDAGITHIRDVALPALQRMDGFIGLSLLVDRGSGRCVATSSWESLAAMRAPAGPIAVIRDRAVEILGGTMMVEEWEILVMHRDHPSHRGACARGTWLRMHPAAIDRAVDVHKMVSIPALEELEGFCSTSLLIERASGRAVSTTTYDSREAMHRNREQADAILSASSQDTGAEVRQLGEFELALAHLRVPEMA
jgi:heme-degrading monooxygenase HmoA